MPDFKKLYFMLFNAATQAEESIDDRDYGRAKRILMEAQQQAEETYMDEGAAPAAP